MPGGVGILKLQIVRRIIGLVIRVVISATDQNIGENANGLVATVSSLASGLGNLVLSTGLIK